ncbi:MAG: bifunctional glutamate N-acetyltransferase/amino-acid acetyltransferase ArgJ [Candidatus Brocadiia bacterium]
MDARWDDVPGGVTAAEGFRAAAVACGIKDSGGDDLGLLVGEPGCTAAATFTTNRVAAAPVRWSRQTLAQGLVRAAVVNSGNANACTGERGLQDAEATAAAAADALGLEPANFLVASTGIIGRLLPMERLLRGVEAAAGQLQSSLDAGARFARALMTTDTVPKEAALRCDLGGSAATLGGATKGAGMVAPHMATTLTFLTTDAAVAPPLLLELLRRAVARTFNRVTVDGHTSTNDTVLVLASGRAAAPVEPGTGAARRFEAALTELCGRLARKLVEDGEGATRLVRIDVVGAPTEQEALAAARGIADSPLCKCAFHSGDPNWGRFVSAAGAVAESFQEQVATLHIGRKLAYAAGAPADTPLQELAAEMAGRHVALRLDMGLGDGAATMWTCDLSKDYVAINADYPT